MKVVLLVVVVHRVFSYQPASRSVEAISAVELVLAITTKQLLLDRLRALVVQRLLALFQPCCLLVALCPGLKAANPCSLDLELIQHLFESAEFPPFPTLPPPH